MELDVKRTNKEIVQDEIVGDTIKLIAETLALKDSLLEHRQKLSSNLFSIATRDSGKNKGEVLSVLNIDVVKGSIKGAYLQRDKQSCQKRCSLWRILEVIGMDNFAGSDLVEELIDNGELQRCENRCVFINEFNNQRGC